jgi:hypothetical protein
MAFMWNQRGFTFAEEKHPEEPWATVYDILADNPP